MDSLLSWDELDQHGWILMANGWMEERAGGNDHEAFSSFISLSDIQLTSGCIDEKCGKWSPSDCHFLFKSLPQAPLRLPNDGEFNPGFELLAQRLAMAGSLQHASKVVGD
jgi:hypothetical protein